MKEKFKVKASSVGDNFVVREEVCQR